MIHVDNEPAVAQHARAADSLRFAALAADALPVRRRPVNMSTSRRPHEERHMLPLP